MLQSVKAKFDSLTPLDSESILWTRGPDGMTAHVRDTPAAVSAPAASASASSSSGSFPCKIDSKSGAFYNVYKYENGIDAASTGTAKVYILGLNFAGTLPAGTWIVASESQIGTTGGGNVP